MHVSVNAPNLAAVAFDATYGPYFYREFTAALRSGLRGDRVPLLRLVAQATGGGTNAGPVRDYSEGLDAAVSCHDYPQLYDMSAAPQVRIRQYHAALARRTRLWPHTYGPFTVREYARSDWESLDWCTRWRSAPSDNPARPPRPPHGYPSVPTLVLSGELDSITTPAEGAMVARQFPRARQILVANSFHVTADGDTDHCAVGILRRFVQTPAHWPQHRCASKVPPVRAMGVFPRHLRDVTAGRGRGDPGRAPHRPGRGRDRGRPARQLVEQLLRPRRRPARWALELHRRPDHGLPPARRAAHVRPRGERDRDLATVRQPALGPPPGPRSGPHGAAARRLGDPASSGQGRPCAASSTVTGSWSGSRAYIAMTECGYGEAMIRTTPFHPRLRELNTQGLYTHWQGFLSPLRYSLCAETRVLRRTQCRRRLRHLAAVQVPHHRSRRRTLVGRRAAA